MVPPGLTGGGGIPGLGALGDASMPMPGGFSFCFFYFGV
jgi:hypothetical protein